MSRTLSRQDRQIRESEVYDDTIVPSEPNFEDLPAHLQDDLNTIRSMLHHLRDVQTSNWWSPLTAPTALEPGSARGVQQVNEALHLLEVKRWLREVGNLTNVVVPASNVVILGAGQLPSQLTAAVGVVTTLGTVVAKHSGTFGTHALDSVPGSGALSPANLVTITDGDTRDPLFSANDQIWGLLQGESTLLDGGTISASSPSRVQISFVKLDSTGNIFVAVPSADIQGKAINYCFRERVRLKDLLEGDLLKGAFTKDGTGTGGGSGISEGDHELLDTLTHQIVENSFDEVARNTKGRITRITVWTDAGKTTKIRESLYTRICGKISQVTDIQYNAAGIETYRVTEVITRVGSQIGEDIVESVTRTRIP